MSLLIVLLLLLIWAVYCIIKNATPHDPPIDNIEEHTLKLMQLSNQKERRKFIKQDAQRRRNLYQQNTDKKE